MMSEHGIPQQLHDQPVSVQPPTAPLAMVAGQGASQQPLGQPAEHPSDISHDGQQHSSPQ